MSLSIISIIFLAMGSVMVLAGKAIPDAHDSSTLTSDTGDIVQQIVSELQTATTVANATATVIEFTVPDRNNDGNDEMIRYVWPGLPGDPLVRVYNGGAPVNVLPDVYEFNLTYDIKSIPQPDILIESAEVELSSHPAVGMGGGNGYMVTSSNWLGQHFQPILPADTASWKVTRVLIQAQGNGPATGETLIQLRPPIPGDVLPSTTVLEQVSMWESFLSSWYVWQEFTFSTVQGLSPNEGLCLVLQWVSGSNSAEIQTVNAPAGMLFSSDGGAIWNYDSGNSILHFVYGTYTTAIPQPPINLLRSVTLTLNPGNDPASRVRTAVTVLNQPQIP